MEGAGIEPAQMERSLSGLELGFKFGALDLAALSGSRSERVEGGLWAAHWRGEELVCCCVKEEEAERSVSAPPLLEAPGNHPEQGTKGIVQGWGFLLPFVSMSASVALSS